MQSQNFSAADVGVRRVIPERAIVLSSVAQAGLSRDISMLVMEHEIYHRHGQTRLGAGHVIGPERLGDMVSELDERAVSRPAPSFLPAHVLANGANFIVWHVPSAIRPMFFSLDGESFCLEVVWPSLIFAAHGHRLSLAATQGGERPDADTPVFHAPLMNHSHEAGLCFGSAERPTRAALDTLPLYERAVFKSYFSHGMGGNNLRYRQLKSPDQERCDDTHEAFYRSLAARRLKRFPSRHLLPLGMTVSEFIEQKAL